jgi:DNA-binding NarL/FixJ family response regulator
MNEERARGSRDANGMEPVRVMLVDDHPVVRDGLRAALERAGDQVVAEAGDGGEAIDLARDAMPDVIVMDLLLPTVSGVDATRRIAEESPHARILVVSVSDEEANVLDAVKAGAVGYVLKSATTDEVVEAVHRTHAGEPAFTPRLASLVLSEFRKASQADVAEQKLTERENEVLRLVAKGYTYPQIADKLFLSVKTVQNHVYNILAKLHLHRRYELMRYAIQKGIDRLPE